MLLAAGGGGGEAAASDRSSAYGNAQAEHGDVISSITSWSPSLLVQFVCERVREVFSAPEETFFFRLQQSALRGSGLQVMEATDHRVTFQVTAKSGFPKFDS